MKRITCQTNIPPVMVSHSSWLHLESTDSEQLGTPVRGFLSQSFEVARSTFKLGHIFWWQPTQRTRKKEASGFLLAFPPSDWLVHLFIYYYSAAKTFLCRSLSQCLQDSNTERRQAVLQKSFGPEHQFGTAESSSLVGWTPTRLLIVPLGDSHCWTTETPESVSHSNKSPLMTVCGVFIISFCPFRICQTVMPPMYINKCDHVYSIFISVAVTDTRIKSNFAGRGFIWLTVRSYSPSLRETKAGTWRQACFLFYKHYLWLRNSLHSQGNVTESVEDTVLIGWQAGRLMFS